MKHSLERLCPSLIKWEETNQATVGLYRLTMPSGKEIFQDMTKRLVIAHQFE